MLLEGTCKIELLKPNWCPKCKKVVEVDSKGKCKTKKKMMSCGEKTGVVASTWIHSHFVKNTGHEQGLTSFFSDVDKIKIKYDNKEPTENNFEVIEMQPLTHDDEIIVVKSGTASQDPQCKLTFTGTVLAEWKEREDENGAKYLTQDGINAFYPIAGQPGQYNQWNRLTLQWWNPTEQKWQKYLPRKAFEVTVTAPLVAHGGNGAPITVVDRRRMTQQIQKAMNSEIPYLAALAILAIGAYYAWISRNVISERVRLASLRSIRVIRSLSLLPRQKQA